MNRKAIVFVSAFVGSVALDQLTKWWVYTHLEYQRDAIHVIPGWLDIVHAQNPGAAMGLLRDFAYRNQLFLLFTLIAVVVIVDLWRRLPKEDVFLSLTLGLIGAGAVGNAIDRVWKQTVTDFIRVYTEVPSMKHWLIAHFGTNEWPSFNIADSSLVVGVSLFLVHYLFVEGDETKAPAASPAPPAPPADGAPGDEKPADKAP